MDGVTRMDFKKFKAVAQDEKSYTVKHPCGKLLFVDKANLAPDAHKAILHLFSGAMVEPGNSIPESSLVPEMYPQNPMASFMPQAPQEFASPEPDTVVDSAKDDAAAYKQFAPDLSKEDIADLDRPVLNKDGSEAKGDFTDAAHVKERANLKAKVDSIPEDGPGPQSAEYKVTAKANNPSGMGAVADSGRAPDSVPQDPLLAQKQGSGNLIGERIQQQEQALADTQAAGQDVANVQEGEASALGKLPTHNEIVAKYQAKDQQLAQAYADAKIDPEHFLHSMSTGSKILTGIGMVLSGMGAATTGQPSYAMQVLNDAIKRDVEAQAANKGDKLNLWKMNREAMGNDQAANLATENQIKAGALAKLQAAQTRAQLPQEKLRAQQAIDDLKASMLQNNMVRGLLTQGQQNAQGQPGALSGADPSMLVPEMVKDPAQQKQVYEEIKNRANIARNGQAMLKAFDQAAKEVSGVGGVIHSGIEKTPGQLALDQLMKPNMSELDGTIRHEAVVGAQETMIPSYKDLGRADRIASKRQSLIDWMKSQQAAPIAKGNYIDLDRFQSTAIPSWAAPPAAPGASAPMGPQTQVMHGHTYQKVPGGWKLVK